MPNDIVYKYTNVYIPHLSNKNDLTLIINDILISHDNDAPCYIVLIYLSSTFDTFNIILFPLDLMKLVYMVNSTVTYCSLFILFL